MHVQCVCSLGFYIRLWRYWWIYIFSNYFTYSICGLAGNKCYPKLESSWLICSLIGEGAVSLAFAASRFWINLEFVLNFGFFTVIVSSWNAIVWKLTVWWPTPTWSTLISCRARDIPSVTSCQWSFSSFSTSLVTSGVAGTVLYCATHLPSITCREHVQVAKKVSEWKLLEVF